MVTTAESQLMFSKCNLSKTMFVLIIWLEDDIKSAVEIFGVATISYRFTNIEDLIVMLHREY
jgi:hypothetical protein